MSEEVVEVEKRTPQSSLRDLYYVLFRHKWKMVLFFFAITVTVTVCTFRAAEIYRSEAKLLVRLGRESVTLDPTATTGQIIGVSRSRESEIISELEILKSRELSEKVVDSIGPEAFLKRPDEQLSVEGAARETTRKTRQEIRTAVKGPRSLLERLDLVEPLNNRDKAVLGVMKNLDIEMLKNSSIISISFNAQSPELAQNVVAKVIGCYLENHIAVHQTPGSHEFFLAQSDHLRSKLVESENELRNLKDETGISSLEEQRRVILERIGTLEREIEHADSELASSKAKVEALRETLANLPETLLLQETTGYTNYGADQMRDRLYELQLKEQDLLSKYTEESRPVREVRREIAEAQAVLDKEEQTRTQVTQGLNTAHQQIQLALLTEQATLTSLRAKLDVQKRQLADAQEGLKTLNDSEVRITRLMREINIEEANYHKYSESLEQARIDHALETGKISNISVVQSATLPIKPIRPRKSLNLALGLLLGILGSIGLAFFYEYLDHSIKTPEEAKDRLQLPTFASIPRVRANRISPSAKQGQDETGGRIWEIPAGIRQYYENLGEQLLQSSDGSAEKPRVFAVVSCHRGEGVSTVATNLSTWLAQRGNGDVLLVDANTTHPSVHRIFKKKLSPGLVDVLENGQCNGDAILNSPVQNLHILSAGIANVNLSQIFDSDRFTNRLSSIKEPYRFVVFDLPAVSQTSIVPRLASLCDGIIIVVEAERLRWEVVQRMKEQLVKAGADVLGVVLNKRRFPIPAWLYRTL
jgi:capsular exopolysaccharide synthesis family protein